jgi:hypothetical protein
MAIVVESKHKKIDTIRKQHPEGLIVDVTSRGPKPWLKFSPFYPHGNIPVPFSPGYVSESVEGVWQGLKVFESVDVDVTRFQIRSMKGLKRTVRQYGRVLGHRKGVHGESLLPYREARFQIYLPTYKWMLEHCLQAELDELKRASETQQVVLLDYETNTEVENLSKPLSHASLIVKYLEGDWPRE